MWPFTHSPSNAELLERLESLERRFKTLLADVDEYFHLVRRAENRMVKKAATMEVHNDGEAGSPINEVPGLGSPTPPFSSLTPRQRQITEQILARRRQMNPEVKQ